MVPPRRIRSARSVAGRPGRGMQRARMSGLEEQGHRLLDGGDGVAGGVRSSPCSAPAAGRPRTGRRAGVGAGSRRVVRRRPGWRPTPGRPRGCGRSARRRGRRPAAPWRFRRRRSGRRRRRPPVTAPVTVPAVNAFARRSATIGSTQPAIGSHTSSGSPGGGAERVEHRDGRPAAVRAAVGGRRSAAGRRPWSG